MSLRRSVAAAALATLSIASAASSSPWVIKPGEFYSELSGSFYSANSFYDEDGHRPSLGARLDERVVRSMNEFGWKKRVSVWIGLPFVNRGFTPYGGPKGATFTSTGLGDLDLGLRLALHRGNSPVALSLGWTAPTGGNRRLYPGVSGEGGLDPTHVPTSPASNSADTSLFFDAGLQSLSAALELGGAAGRRAYWTLGGAYRYRFLEFAEADEDSAGITTKFRHNAYLFGGAAELGFWLRPQLLVTGMFQGEWAISQSKIYDGDALLDLKSKTMLAGPRFTYRVDDRMDVFGGSWHSIAGRHTLHHDQYYCGIAWKQTGLDRLAGALGGTKPR